MRKTMKERKTKMRKTINNAKRITTVLILLCICFNIIATCIYATETIKYNTMITKEITQELTPMTARGCGTSRTLAWWMSKFSSKYDFTYQNTGLGYNMPLSNGYYYHAYAQTNNYVFFIYNSSNECIETGYFSGV